MYVQHTLIGAIASFTFASAIQVPRAYLEPRSDVDNCKAILIALKASSFCSSFVPIKDVTSTVTPSALSVTVTTSCTPAKKKRNAVASTTTTTKPSSTKATTAKSLPTTTAKTLAPTFSTSSAVSKCSIKGVPAAAQIFACEIITGACLAYVKPKTSTITGTQPTISQIVTPTCPSSTTTTTTSTSTTSQCQPVPTTDPRCGQRSGACCPQSTDQCIPCTNGGAVCIKACDINSDCIYGGLNSQYNPVVAYGGDNLCIGYTDCTGCPPSKRELARSNVTDSRIDMVQRSLDGSALVYRVLE